MKSRSHPSYQSSWSYIDGLMMNPWLVGLDWFEELPDMGNLPYVQPEQQQFSALAMRVKTSMLPVSLPGGTFNVKNVIGAQPKQVASELVPKSGNFNILTQNVLRPQRRALVRNRNDHS